MSKRNEILSRLYEDIQENPLPWFIQVLGVGVLLVNVWLASKLAPLTENDRLIIQRVEALEQRNVKNDPLILEFVTLKETVNSIKDNIVEIKDRQVRLESKLDSVITQIQ